LIPLDSADDRRLLREHERLTGYRQNVVYRKSPGNRPQLRRNCAGMAN
jgi:hypothetical protein